MKVSGFIMDIIQYAPKCIYEDINSILSSLKEQSNLLHKNIQSIDLKCTHYEFISENEIDNLINTIRNYTLIKESCLEQSSKILCVDNVKSIDLLSSKIKEHQDNSISIMNEVLYYAYEFLKIKSDNVITDGLLQDHHEKLKSIIDAMLNEFVDINEVNKQLEPYKIALLYVTNKIQDLTPYAELINNTFGAILFYNIISGNNIHYDTNFEHNEFEVKYDDTIIETNISQDADSNIVEEVETIAENDNTLETSEEGLSLKDNIDDIHKDDLSNVKHIELNPKEEIYPEVVNLEVSNIIDEVNSSIEHSIIEETLENAPKQIDEIDYFENLSTSIEERYNIANIISYNNVSFNEEIAVNTICDYIISKEFSCASMILKEYSNMSIDMENLYNEYGLAVGDPSINYDYSNVFITDTIEHLHSWLQLSTLLREMFICKNKESECYNFISYMNSLIQSINDTVLVYIPNFSSILKIFDEVEYNTNYIIGVKLFDEKNIITSKIKQDALLLLTYCEQTMHNWNHKVMSDITKNLFSSSGGYIYNLIKEVSLGDFKVIENIKSYCSPFADDNGNILDGLQLNNKVYEYVHDLWINSSKRFNSDNDVNIGYKNKFANRFIHILKFLFSCVEKINAFDVNYINENNVDKYRNLRSTLIDFFEANSNSLLEKSNSGNVSKLDRVGMICLSKAFKDIISYINYDDSTQNYFYCGLLKTGYFILDDMYIPYLNESIDSINGLEISTRVEKHLQEVKGITSWEDAIKNNIKKLDVGNVHLIVSYLKDTNQYIDTLQPYIDEANSIKYSIEGRFNQFYSQLTTLCIKECLPNRDIINRILNMESIARNVITQDSNYGFYEMFLNLLENYAVKISEESYNVRNDIVQTVATSIGYDSEYYTSIVKYIDSHSYSMADTLLSMYFNGIEYPNSGNNSRVEQYNEIFSQFREFCNSYADDLSSPNGYVFMNEFYDNIIKPIVVERFAGSYDCVKSDELIDSWSKGQDTTNVVYDVLTNIGFSIEKSIEVDNHTFKMVLSNYEKNSSQPYIIPENTIFLNGIYNIAQADRSLNSLNIMEDTLIVMDYALNIYEREHVLEVVGKISNGNRVVLVDRCVIMFLTIIPSNVRKLALKVCSVCDVSNNISYVSDFRIDYVQAFIEGSGSNLLLGREYFGKTYIINSIAETLKSNDENIVILIDAFDDFMHTPDLIISECNTLSLKINPFTDWDTFETSMTRYLNKHPNKKVYLLIDNAEDFLKDCVEANLQDTSLESELTSIVVLKNLSSKFEDRFNFTMTADVSSIYLDYANRCNLTYQIIKPLSYDETAKMFESYLNGSKISINGFDTMTMLVSLTFGCPEMVRLISKRILSIVDNQKDTFEESYTYTLTLDTIYKLLGDKNFMNMLTPVFLSTVIGNQESDSCVIPVIYGMVYYLYEHSNTSKCTVNDIRKVLNIFDIEESTVLSIQDTLNQLCLLGIVCKFNDDEYFFSHDAYKYYFGSKEFTFDILDCCTKIFAKDGITQ